MVSFNFLLDTAISLFLAIAYIILSSEASKDIQHTKVAFSFLWLCLALTYLVFIWWDINDYYNLRKIQIEEARFYLGMVRWFEISGVIAFTIMGLIPFAIHQANWFSQVYVVISLSVLAAYSFWFYYKLGELEKNTRLTSGETIQNENDLKDISNDVGEITLIRPTKDTDIDFCAKIFIDAYRDVYSENWPNEAAISRLTEIYLASPKYCFSLCIKGVVAGFLFARLYTWHDGMRVWIEEVIIEKQYRGYGYGKLLFQALNAQCYDNQVVGSSLLSQKNSMAFKMYKRMGFAVSDWMHMERITDRSE